jgi:hypothetical protein
MLVIPSAQMRHQKISEASENQIRPTSVAWLLAYSIVFLIKIDEDGFGDILGGKHREMLKLI